MMSIIEILNFLPQVVDIILKLALFSIALFFGRIAISGWRGKLDFITRFIGAILVGFICFAVGILLPFDFLPQIKFVSEMINSLIVAAIMYIILLLISFKSKPEILTKKDIVGVEKEVEFLKAEVAKINNALIKKGIVPREATQAEVKKAVKDAIANAGIKDYSIKSVEKKENMWEVLVDVDGREYIAIVDTAGNVKEFTKQGFDFSDITTRLKKDKFFLAGTIVAVVFALFVFSLLTPSNIERVSQTFSFYGVNLPKEEGCLSPITLLDDWNNNESRVSNFKYSLQDVDGKIDEFMKQDLNSVPFLYGSQVFVSVNSTTYGAFFVSNESITSMPKFLSVLQGALMTGDGYICSVDLTNDAVCGCEKLDNPRLTVQVSSVLKEYSQQWQ